MIYSYENLQWLKKQLWAWILFGILIMSIFFYIAKGLIVFVGGAALGMYLYNKFGETEYKVGGKLFDSTINAANVVNNMLNPQKPINEPINEPTNENFINGWWKPSRY